MNKRTIPTVLLLGAFVLAGCQREEAVGPTELTGRIFVFNYRVSTATYLVTLKKTGDIPEGTVAIAEFENPMGGEPLVTREKIFPFWQKIDLESPALHCVVKDRPYAITVRLVGPDENTLQTIETTVTSDLDQTTLAAKPLVVGPAYERNPEVFKDQGKADYSPDPLCRT
ncbi:hypothetical protein MRS76_03800 [Rhizobiaceae bacterium n13]|uniref:Uncharacterized protein n=1 Tax=Ferirhizobium litorale TaxID=2927786 RepID=A0AAE3Q8I8_9HYPH|nr:hypothetical protein [Fererhizobium litorale]MDI7861070.1 hypothetical protein [Fererhizobium litorale]MDI7921217.1 hypothetical protein [Fererhizobium litorale]